MKRIIFCSLLLARLYSQGITVGNGITISVGTFGGKNDGKALGDGMTNNSGCSMSSGSPTLTCASGTFSSGDVGKVIAVWDAGTASGGFIQSLSSTISAFTDSAHVTLENNAGSTTRTVSISTCATSSANLVCTTTSAHGINPVFDMLTIASVAGCTNANGTFPVGSYTGSNTTLTLLGVNCNSAYTSGGTASAGLFASRVVWGTNNTAALQAAVDYQATRGGGAIYFPAGIYLTQQVTLPCPIIGALYSGASLVHTCTLAYNNITLYGDGPTSSILENWDISVTSTSAGGGNANTAVVLLGQWASGIVNPAYTVGNGGPPEPPLVNISIHDLGLHQVKNPTSNQAKTLSSYGTNNVQIQNLSFFGPSYEGLVPCGGDRCLYWTIQNAAGVNVGFGGPGYGGNSSAFNMNCSLCSLVNSSATITGQGVEIGGHDIQISNNQFIGPNVAAYISSECLYANSGTFWRITIRNNSCTSWSGIAIINVFGMSTLWDIENNIFNDIMAGFAIEGGLESNNVTLTGVPLPPPHGLSKLIGNTFNYSNTPGAIPVSGTIQIKSADNAPIASGSNNQESFVLERNTVTFGGSAVPIPIVSFGPAYGGGSKWIPSTAYTVYTTGSATQLAIVVPNLDNTYYFTTAATCTSGTSEPTWPTTAGNTVSDGGCTWTNAGHRPIVTLSNLEVSAPSGFTNSLHFDFIFDQGASRKQVVFSNVAGNYTMWFNNSGGTSSTNTMNVNERIPPGFPFSDGARIQGVSTVPTGGFYNLGTTINSYPFSGTGWIVTTAGYAAQTWTSIGAAGTIQGGGYIQPTSANGHLYIQTVYPSCTTGGSEPGWNTSGGVTTDNTCSYQDEGLLAAVFTAH